MKYQINIKSNIQNTSATLQMGAVVSNMQQTGVLQCKGVNKFAVKFLGQLKVLQYFLCIPCFSTWFSGGDIYAEELTFTSSINQRARLNKVVTMTP